MTSGHIVISSNNYRSPIDPTSNGIVLVGEGGRVQIAVLCSTLGVGCRAMRASLSGTEYAPAGWVRPASAAAAHLGDRSMTDSKAVTTGARRGLRLLGRFCSMGAGRTKRSPRDVRQLQRVRRTPRAHPPGLLGQHHAPFRWRSYRFCLMFRLSWPGTAVAHRPVIGLPWRSLCGSVGKHHSSADLMRCRGFPCGR